MQNLISLIVPLYKVEKFIRRCRDSLLQQTYGDLEIILVNEGSLDSYSEICDEYTIQDEGIKVHKENGGLSDIRIIVAWVKMYKSHLFKKVRITIREIYKDEFTTSKVFRKLYISGLFFYLQRRNSIMGVWVNLKSGLHEFVLLSIYRPAIKRYKNEVNIINSLKTYNIKINQEILI